MKSDTYMTRALRADDPRYERVLSRLGYGRSDLVVDEPQKNNEPPAQDAKRRKRTKKVDS